MVSKVTDSVTNATVRVAVATAASKARALSTVEASWGGRELPNAPSANVLSSARKAAAITQAAGTGNRLLPSLCANRKRQCIMAGSYED